MSKQNTIENIVEDSSSAQSCNTPPVTQFVTPAFPPKPCKRIPDVIEIKMLPELIVPNLEERHDHSMSIQVPGMVSYVTTPRSSSGKRKRLDNGRQ
jgi:hypothetical protein